MAWRSKRKVMHAYDVTADIYDERYSGEQHLKYWKTLESVDVTDALVLDVGCGSGMFFPQVADKAKTIVGVDVSKQLLLKAKANAAANVDIYGEDKEGRMVIIEVKRRTATKENALQLAKYIDPIKAKVNKRVRAVLVAPSLAKDVGALLDSMGLEFKALDPKDCAVVLKKKKTHKLESFFSN